MVCMSCMVTAVRDGSGVPVFAGNLERKPRGRLGLQDIHSPAGAHQTRVLSSFA
jgi:hypothetical protein